jgi:hypothetical protein
MRTPVLSLLLLSCLSTPVLAQAPKAEIDASLEDAKGGAVLTLTGKLANVPEGTKLHVTLSVRGVKADAAFFMTPVLGGVFKARKNFPRRVLAPLSYVLNIELWLQAQRKAIGDQIRREWGLPSGSKVVVASHRLDVGTLEEQNAFRLATIKKLLEFVTAARQSHTLISTGLGKPKDPDKKVWLKGVIGLARTVKKQFGQPFSTYLAKYVVLHERTAISDIQLSKSALGAAISNHIDGKDAKVTRSLTQTDARLTRVKEELESRLPDSEKKEKTGEEGEKQGSTEGEKKTPKEGK